MGTFNMKKFLPVTASIALAVISSSAMAATDWNYNLSTQCDPSVNAGTYVAQCGVTNPDLTLSGWSTATGTTSNPTAGTTFAAAKIYDWGSSGLGVVASNESSNSTGPHSTDNKNGTDAILLSFDNAVDLESIKIGWNGTDNGGSYDTGESSDISILAYTGLTPPSPDMSGASLATLTSSGWTLVGNYGQVGMLANETANISSSITSSWWLISAYNAAYGNQASSSGYALTAGNDYFKLLSVAGNNPPRNETPEPGSMVLLGAGLVGMMALRRRRQTEN